MNATKTEVFEKLGREINEFKYWDIVDFPSGTGIVGTMREEGKIQVWHNREVFYFPPDWLRLKYAVENRLDLGGTE